METAISYRASQSTLPLSLSVSSQNLLTATAGTSTRLSLRSGRRAGIVNSS